MPHPDPVELARHIDRVRRRFMACRDGMLVRELPGGWMSFDPAARPAEFPSTSNDRVYWLTASGPISAEHVSAAQEEARGLSCRRLFIWLAPWGWSDGVEAMLAGAGASPWPDVEHIALARSAGACPTERVSGFEMRIVGAGDAAAVLDEVRPWYGESGARSLLRVVQRGEVELHAAFEGSHPVAVSMLTLDGDWAYLGAAGTDPARRGRGAQTALIRARVEHAAERGAA